jgi:hypothetical protein
LFVVDKQGGHGVRPPGWWLAFGKCSRFSVGRIEVDVGVVSTPGCQDVAVMCEPPLRCRTPQAGRVLEML